MKIHVYTEVLPNNGRPCYGWVLHDEDGTCLCRSWAVADTPELAGEDARRVILRSVEYFTSSAAESMYPPVVKDWEAKEQERNSD